MDNFFSKKLIGRFWDSVSTDKTRPRRMRWWESPAILRHINRKVCGKDLPGFSQGAYELLKERYIGLLPLGRGVSVGCGNGSKELKAAAEGIVRSFDLFELSSVRVEQGRELAKKAGCLEMMNFRMEDAFESVKGEGLYDIVYWNNSLHHMMDTEKALSWSHRVLKKGGVFFMDDYIGPSRMQWTERTLEVGTLIRQTLDDRYLKDPRNPEKLLPKKISRPDIVKLTRTDPSECADSARILENLKKFFPGAEVVLTGGAVYHTALSDVIHNIDEEKDANLLKLLLLIDDLCAETGESQYAVALARK